MTERCHLRGRSYGCYKSVSQLGVASSHLDSGNRYSKLVCVAYPGPPRKDSGTSAQRTRHSLVSTADETASTLAKPQDKSRVAALQLLRVRLPATYQRGETESTAHRWSVQSGR